jgi:hypothetical protein
MLLRAYQIKPPGCRRLALGLSRECGWDWDGGGGMEGVWTGSTSAVRVVSGLSNQAAVCVNQARLLPGEQGLVLSA